MLALFFNSHACIAQNLYRYTTYNLHNQIGARMLCEEVQTGIVKECKDVRSFRSHWALCEKWMAVNMIFRRIDFIIPYSVWFNTPLRADICCWYKKFMEFGKWVSLHFLIVYIFYKHPISINYLYWLHVIRDPDFMHGEWCWVGWCWVYYQLPAISCCIFSHNAQFPFFPATPGCTSSHNISRHPNIFRHLYLGTDHQKNPVTRKNGVISSIPIKMRSTAKMENDCLFCYLALTMLLFRIFYF